MLTSSASCISVLIFELVFSFLALILVFLYASSCISLKQVIKADIHIPLHSVFNLFVRNLNEVS